MGVKDVRGRDERARAPVRVGPLARLAWGALPTARYRALQLRWRRLATIRWAWASSAGQSPGR
jgi:hypothetical protein